MALSSSKLCALCVSEPSAQSPAAAPGRGGGRKELVKVRGEDVVWRLLFEGPQVLLLRVCPGHLPPTLAGEGERPSLLSRAPGATDGAGSCC